MGQRTVTYRRSELYDQVWSEPMQTVAKRYGVSGVALAKMCRKMRVPYPGRGYWAQIAAGKKSRRPLLPTLTDGVKAEISITRHVPDPRIVSVSPETEKKIEAEKAPEATIVVATTLESPHKLVASAEKRLRREKTQDGIVSCRKARCLDISVAPESIDRALRIMDAVIRALDARGLKVDVTEEAKFDQNWNRINGTEPANATRVRVDGEWLYFSLSERKKEHRPPPPTPPRSLSEEARRHWARINRPAIVRTPSGQLILTLKVNDDRGHHSVWKETHRKPLESCLNEFVAALYVAAEDIKKERAAVERRRLEREDEQQRAYKESMQRYEDERHAKLFREKIENRRFARELRQYVADVRALLAKGECNASADFEKQLSWADTYANRIDPVAALQGEIDELHAKRAKDSEGEGLESGSAETSRPEDET